MAILFFSIVVVIGFLPAAFCLDRLFAINFANAAKRRPSMKDVIWQPRGFADTSAGEANAISRRPIGEGLSWLIKTPASLAEDDTGGVLLKAYRFSAFLMLVGILGVALFLFVF